MADTILQEIGTKYPRLLPYTGNTVVQYLPDPHDGRQLEYYAPWERDNPTPGRLNIQIYNKDLSGDALRDAIAGDMLHYLGSTDPISGKPVDPNWQRFRQRVANSRTQSQIAADQQDYKDTKDERPFSDYLDQSRLDAYMRALLFPANNPEWSGYLTPAQRDIGASLQTYLSGGQ